MRTSAAFPDGFVSVIIPVYNGARTLPACLAALQQQTISPQHYEVIVVDDGSADGSADIALQLGARVIRQPHRGAAAARNAGIAAARGEIVLFTDADCIPTSDWIAQMTQPLANSAVDGVKGAYRTTQDNLIARFVQLEYEDRYDRAMSRETIDFVDTYAAAYRRSVLLTAGGFDERFPGAAVEDVELSYRLAAQGRRLVFNPHAIVYHSHPATLWHYLRRKAIYGYWRVPVYARYPDKTGGDAHTPPLLKWQLGLAAVTLILFPFVGWSALARGLWLLTVAIFLATTVPFVLKALRCDPLVAFISLGLSWLRAVAIGLGLMLGLVYFRYGWYPMDRLRMTVPFFENVNRFCIVLFKRGEVAMRRVVHLSRDLFLRKSRLRLWVVLDAMLVAALLLSAMPTAWTVVEAAPSTQTIPPPTPPTPPTPVPPEKKKEVPGATPTPSLGILGVPVDVRLGPGDGLFHLPMPNAGCIQINVSGMPSQLLFQIIPLDPMTLAAPPPECRRTTAAYSIKVWDTSTGQETFTVAPNYIHTICYNDADLAAANGDPSRFVIARYDETTQTWVKLEPSIVDASNRHVVGTTGQTGWWALLACEAAPILLPETGQAPSSSPFLAILAIIGALVVSSGLWFALRGRVQHLSV